MPLAPASPNDFEAPELRRRAQSHSAGDDFVLLRAGEGADEWGLVVLDFETGDDDEAILVEIFILRDRRKAGNGTQTLISAEYIAREKGRKRMSLEAEPLDCEPDDDDAKVTLIRWYRQRG